VGGVNANGVMNVESRPLAGQKPGTSGLRKKAVEFAAPHYLENFVQSIFDAVPELVGGALVLGGDGRYYNRHAVQVIARMAAANGIGRLVVGRGGLLSTPAASALIRQRAAGGGIVLSASHNPGGRDGDFGIKFNGANGGPASETVTAAIYACTESISHYRTLDSGPIDMDIDRLGESRLGGMVVEVVDPVTEYANLLEGLFDFAKIKDWLASARGLFHFDAMHAVTGPYAETIFGRRLGVPSAALLRCTAQEDFGGCHPDPHPAHTPDLLAALTAAPTGALGAASDGDGDRNMVLGREWFVNPCDSLAVIAANAELLPGYRHGLVGVARSMPTSRAVDRVAAALDIPCYETPTGWKFFGNLLDAGKINLCGEESFGTGSDHLREKDGLWAVLCWLTIVAERELSPAAILADHWRRYGRDYFTRHDYEGLDSAAAEQLLARLVAELPDLAGRRVGTVAVSAADQFSYTDPVDGSQSSGQGVRLWFDDGSRAVIRLSGTGTAGATLRLYFDRHEPTDGDLDAEPQAALAAVIGATAEVLQLAESVGRSQPDVVT